MKTSLRANRLERRQSIITEICRQRRVEEQGPDGKNGDFYDPPRPTNSEINGSFFIPESAPASSS